MLEDKEVRWVEDVIDFMYMFVMLFRIMDFLSSDKIIVDVREKYMKLLFL